MRVVLLLIVSTFVPVLCKDFQVELTYSTEGTRWSPIGTLSLIQKLDGNYTGTLQPVDSLTRLMASSVKSAVHQAPNSMYYVKAGDLLSSNTACAILRARLGLQISVSVDQDRAALTSLTVYPKNLYDVGPEGFDCTKTDEVEGYSPVFSTEVVVSSVKELPTPETAAYLQKVDEEKRARQHGAAQDNRSFLAKYWMYIVPVALFMIVSSVLGGEEGQ